VAYQSEAELEKRLIDDLINYKNYTRVSCPDEPAIERNFREQIAILNKDSLSGTPLSDKEFERILVHIKGKSVYESAIALRDKFILPRDDGSEVYLKLFDPDNLLKNIFQVSSQVTMVGKYTNRYDVTILINGLPLLQIELKRRGLAVREAFNQIERYRKHSYQGLYRFIQIFIISNGVDTKYYANSDGPILYNHTFFWSDEKNERITSLNEFTRTFLERATLAETIARFMVINNTGKYLMVMRPYQIYAVKELVKRALETQKNGFIWHATGSGKTLSAFKASQLIALEPSIKKVIFLVDRKDLDTQAMQEFNSYEEDAVDETSNTRALLASMKKIDRKLVLTTIQKMNNAIQNPRYAAAMEAYRDDKVVFIVDECHRSQFGAMHRLIDKHFKNAQYLGFTGTPLFEVNKSADGRTTADIFCKCLHEYLTKDAIKDNNVLGFSVEYIKTFEGEYDETDKTMVLGIDTAAVFESQDRVDIVTENILQCHNSKTRNRQYCAIFATPKIETLVRYYDTFKIKDHDLNIAAVFTFAGNEDGENRAEHSRDSLERMIKDYNQSFATNYSTETFRAYVRDVADKVKKAQVDILLVVNMFLTGFDSQPLNTLYVDKNLEYHGLMQAFSRTNRVEKSTKPFGNIVCYRNLKDKTDEAIYIYSRTDDVNDVLRKNFTHYRDEFKALLKQLYAMVLTPADVDKLASEEDKKAFITLFRDLTRHLVIMQTFVDFEFEEDVLGISEQRYQDFKSKYLYLYDEARRLDAEKVSILADIDFDIEIMQTDRINVAYIMNLIKNIDLRDKKRKEQDAAHIISELNRTDNPELRLKVDLLKEFLERVLPGLGPDSAIMHEYTDFENEARKKEIEAFAAQRALSPEFIGREVAEYEYSGITNSESILAALEDKKFLEKMRLKNEILNFIISHVEKYE
jgi:type I restriction enzyme, R subunit